jgi:carboxypeptidase T
VDLHNEPANGIWRLQVYDAATGDIGYIDSWTLTL